MKNSRDIPATAKNRGLMEEMKTDLGLRDRDTKPRRGFTKRQQALKDAIFRVITRPERLVIILYYIERLNVGEIAMVLRIKKSEVERRRLTALHKLKAAIADH
jgi:RNA polymerase sigma factor (sigma-70 family)